MISNQAFYVNFFSELRMMFLHQVLLSFFMSCVIIPLSYDLKQKPTNSIASTHIWALRLRAFVCVCVYVSKIVILYETA